MKAADLMPQEPGNVGIHPPVGSWSVVGPSITSMVVVCGSSGLFFTFLLTHPSGMAPHRGKEWWHVGTKGLKQQDKEWVSPQPMAIRWS